MRLSGGKNTKKGTPQGGVISPILANRYMNRFLRYWEKTGQARRLQARIVSYADDFVSRGQAARALDWTRGATTRLGLTLNEVKTKLRDARRERFEFLGYSFGPHRHWREGKLYLGASPSPKSVPRPRQSVRDHLQASQISGALPHDALLERAPALAGNPGWVERDSARLGRLLLLRNAVECRIERSTVMPYKTCRVFLDGGTKCPREALTASVSKRSSGSWASTAWLPIGSQTAGSVDVKPAGKPDAGNRHPSGSMSGEGERGAATWPKLPRLSSTLRAPRGRGLPVEEGSTRRIVG